MAWALAKRTLAKTKRRRTSRPRLPRIHSLPRPNKARNLGRFERTGRVMTDDELRKLYMDAGLDPEPYIEMARKAQAYKKQYYADHSMCPKCGYDKYSSTYIGFIINPEHPETYKDTNRVSCGRCDWTGITHDLTGET